MGATEALAKFAVATDSAAISTAARREACRHIIDCIGVALGGSTDVCAHIVTDYARKQGGDEESTIWADGSRVSAQGAALANGTVAHVLDYDDTAYAMPGHPTVCVLPPVIAMAEHLGASGRDALAAYVIGVEVAGKLGQLTGQDSWDWGWHSTSTLGVVGATAAAGRLAGLDVTAMRHALGIAVSQASGVRQNFGSMTKPLHVGNCCQSAIMAVKLAQAGFTASSEAIEGEVGFCKVFGGAKQRDDVSMAQSLGRPYELDTSRVSIKAYPCCGSIHGSIGAALQVAAGLSEPGIDKVILDVPYTAPLILIHHRPTTPMAAKFSLEYCVATALLHGRVALGQFTEEAVTQSPVQALLQRVSYRVPDEWKKGAGEWNMANARIEVHMKDGSIRRAMNSVRKGDAIIAPLSDAELEAKFIDCAGVVLDRPAADALFKLLQQFERIDNVRSMTRHLSLPKRKLT